ncbi:MAG: TetR/AcrR family transcriptional regulator [Bacteroidota bacterium]
MKRIEHKDEVLRKVLETSKELFKEHGFHKTSIRQITAASGIRIGTLYHFFKDKEDIFRHIIYAFMEDLLDQVKELSKGKDPWLEFSLENYLHLNKILKHEKIAELYVVAQSSEALSKELMEERQKRDMDLLGEILPELSEEDFRIRTYMLLGYFQKFAQEVGNGRLDAKEAEIYKALEVFLSIYHLEKEKIHDLMLELKQISSRI